MHVEMHVEINSNLEEVKEKSVDDIIIESGCGLSQYLLEIIFLFMHFSFAYQVLIMYYAADSPPWECSSRNNSAFCIKNSGKQFERADTDFKKRCNLNRSDWSYTTDAKYSIVTEYDLICSRLYIADLVNAAFFIGWGVGGIFTGLLADRYGRKLSFSTALLTQVIFAIASCYTTAVWQLSILRGLIGISTGTCFTVMFIYLSEFSLPQYRSLALNVVQITYSVSLIVLSVLAIYIRKWRDLELYAAFPGLIAFILSLFIPESPRWLNEAGKVGKAENVLRKMATLNKKSLTSFHLQEVEQKENHYSYIDLFKSCSLISFVGAQAIGWLAVGLVYFGLSLESSALGGSIYTNFILSNIADIVGDIIAIFVCNWFGRRKSTLVSLASCGIILACIVAVPKSVTGGSIIRIILAMIGKVLVVVAFSGYYIWSTELFPTVLHTQGLTLCQIACRIGSASAPFVASILQSVYEHLPFIIMGSVSVIAAVCGLILPETYKKPTRERFEDIFDKSKPVKSDVEPLVE